MVQLIMITLHKRTKSAPSSINNVHTIDIRQTMQSYIYSNNIDYTVEKKKKCEALKKIRRVLHKSSNTNVDFSTKKNSTE